MKKISIFVTILMITMVSLFAQVPQKMTYQAVVRNASNGLVANQNVTARFTILQGNQNGIPVYIETHYTLTNSNGLMTVTIGDGTPVSEDFSNINWHEGPFFLKSEIDPNGADNYSITGIQQLLSVPYALYAEKAGNVSTFAIVPTDTGYVISITQDGGTQQTIFLHQGTPGPQGAIGPQGPQGPAGFSPTVVTTSNGDSTVVVITDEEGQHRFVLYNGAQSNASHLTTDSLTELNNKLSQLQQQLDSLQQVIENDHFICGTSTVTDIDGNTYNTVKIGEQCWMKENLRTTRYSNGVEIPVGNDTSSIYPYRYAPDNNENYVSTYGYLYNWVAVMNGVSSSSSNPSGVQGICPTGWHVPSDAEWTQLTNYVSGQNQYQCLGDNTYIAKALAATTGWNSSVLTCAVGNIPSSNNATGFSALPAVRIGSLADFWSATAALGTNAYNWYIGRNAATVDRAINHMNCEYSVRCVRNNCSVSDYLQGISMQVTAQQSSVNEDVIYCPSTVMDIDGNTYNTVRIGEQCWMKENLRTTHYSNGTEIPAGNDTSSISPYRYGSESYAPTYGYLYNWVAVMNGDSSSSTNPSGVQGICPTGWHVPSNAEWKQLTNYVSDQNQYQCGNNNYIAKALASTTGWANSITTCAVGNTSSSNNATGFSALPAGYYFILYNPFGFDSFFWSATETSDTTALSRIISAYSATVNSAIQSKYFGLSVRCVSDNQSVGDYLQGINEQIAAQQSVIDSLVPAAFSGNYNDLINTPTIPTVPTNVSAFNNDVHYITEEQLNAILIVMNSVIDSLRDRIEDLETNSGLTIDTIPTIDMTVNGQACPDMLTVTDYDGNIYNTVQIGNQCWMKENMRVTHYADGTTITQATIFQQSDSIHYYYNPGYDTVYGYLYNWPAAMGSSIVSIINQGVCPLGWHVPSNSEWSQLIQYVGSQSQYICSNNSTYIAKALASTTGWSSTTIDCAAGNTPNSNNATGFNALPAGFYNCFGDFVNEPSASFWSSTDSYSLSLVFYNPVVALNNNITKCKGLSVRCVHD